MRLKILTIPNPILRQPSLAVKLVDKKVLSFIKDLSATLERQDHPKGIGLSAVQTGKLWRIFLTYLPEKAGGKPAVRAYINPEITTASKKLTLGPNPKKPILEGCLSVPKIYGPVYRHTWLKLKWLDPTGQTLMAKFSAFPARVIQHELDHLNGILFTDHSVKDNLPLYEDKDSELIRIS